MISLLLRSIQCLSHALMSAYCIACNNCSKQLDATAIRTACNHLFCLVCATEHFSNGCTCPTCHTTLSSKHVEEVIVGIPPMSVKQCMLQLVLQNSEWEHIVQSVEHIRQASDEVTNFIQKQLLLAGSSDYQRRASLVEQLEESRSELSKTIAKARSQQMISEQQEHELNHQCRAREKELGDLKEAYKEKKRQCDAWEKVYKKLKADVESGGHHSGGQSEFPSDLQQLSDINNVSSGSSNSNNNSFNNSFSSSNGYSGSSDNAGHGSHQLQQLLEPRAPHAPRSHSTTTTMTTTDSRIIVHNNNNINQQASNSSGHKRPYFGHAPGPIPALNAKNLSMHNSHISNNRTPAHACSYNTTVSRNNTSRSQPINDHSVSGSGNGDNRSVGVNREMEPDLSTSVNFGTTFTNFHNNSARLANSAAVSGQASRFFDRLQ